MKAGIIFTIGSAFSMFSINSSQAEMVVEWARSGGGSSVNDRRSIAIDDQGNTYQVGYFVGTVMFLGQTVTSNVQEDAFIVKYLANGDVA